MTNTRTPLTQSLDRLERADDVKIRRLNDLHDELGVLLRATDATMERYGDAAEESEAALCCPITYDADTSHIPQEILDIDYGCGDPTVYAEEGQTVLDLGSGSGKHCFMIARKVGPAGRVIGVDKTPEMLARARAAVWTVTANLGFPAPNVEFRHGCIENLRIDKDRLLGWLGENTVKNYDDLERLEVHLDESPMVASSSVDLVVSNCVLNLVDDNRKKRLLREIFRVVRRGGSVAISDIVADRPIPDAMKQDPTLWSGCLSGAFQWHDFHQAFEEAGFHGIREEKSWFWQRVGEINFFSVTVRAWKGKQGPCYETYRNALYKGPYRVITDDDGHVFERGQWTPVCQKTAELLLKEPYAGQFEVTPALEDPEKKLPFDCSLDGGGARGLGEEQRRRFEAMLDAGDCCGPESCC